MVNTGYNQSLYWADEDTYGSAATVDQPVGLVQSVNPTETNNFIKIRTMGGTRDYSNIVPGKFEVSGSFEYYLQGGAFLRQAWGEDTGTAGAADAGPRTHATSASSTAYVHVLGSAASPTADSFPSFTLEFTDEADDGTSASTKNLKRTYTGCRVNSLTMSGSVDEPVRINVDWMAQGVTVSTSAATSVTEASVDPFVFYQGAVYATSGTIEYDDTMDSASQLSRVNAFDLTVNNNLEATWYVSGTTADTQTLRGLKNLLAKGRDYEGSLELHFEDKLMYQRFLGSDTATESEGTLNKYQIVLDFVRVGTIGTPDPLDDRLRIVLAETAFNDINITGSPEDIVSESLGLSIESGKVYIVDADSDYT